MCWVMPPASPLATSVSRIASSSEVLPWSTWPMIVTTGGRAHELLVGVLEDGLADQLVGGVDDLDVLVELGREHADRLVGERLRERRHLAEAHQLADHLGHGDAEVLGDVLDGRAGVDPDQVGRAARGLVDRRDGVVVGAAAAASAARRPAHRLGGRAAGLAARGLRVDHDAAAAARADRAGALLAGARVARRARAGGLGGARRLAGARLGDRRRRGSASARRGRRRRGGVGRRRGRRRRRGGGLRGCGRGARRGAAARRRRPRGGRRRGLAAVGAAAPLGPSTLSAAPPRRVEAAALASMPAACSLASSSLVVRPWAFAISCTRFFAISPPILRSVRRSAHGRRNARCRPPRRPRGAGSPPQT